MTAPQTDLQPSQSTAPIAAGFTFLGLLVGSIAGLSSAELTLPLFGFLFALVGGSVIAFIEKIPKESMGAAGIALATFSAAAIFSLYGALFVKVNEVLYLQRPAANAGLAKGQSSDPSVAAASRQDLMRASESKSLVGYLNQEVVSGHLPLVDACSHLAQTPPTRETTRK